MKSHITLTSKILTTQTIGVYAVSEVETSSLKVYLSTAGYTTPGFPISGVKTYLWVLLDIKNKLVLNWQTLKACDNGPFNQEIMSDYFTSSHKHLPFHVFQDPDEYPEYFL